MWIMMVRIKPASLASLHWLTGFSETGNTLSFISWLCKWAFPSPVPEQDRYKEEAINSTNTLVTCRWENVLHSHTCFTSSFFLIYNITYLWSNADTDLIYRIKHCWEHGNMAVYVLTIYFSIFEANWQICYGAIFISSCESWLCETLPLLFLSL